MVQFDAVVRLVTGDYFNYVLALAVAVAGIVAGYVVGKTNKRLLTAVGVPEAIEGTAFERTAQGLGSSTVSLLARLSSWFIYGVAVLAALHVAQLLNTQLFWTRVTNFIPNLFVAVVVFIVGIVVGDKAELIVSERLRGVKLPEVGLVGTAAKYSVVYVFALVALGQLGVRVLALVVMLGAYAFAVVLFGAVAGRDLLSSAAAGVYLLLREPYGIGDRVRLDGQEGIVQEVGVFVTHVESDDTEHVVPNRKVLREGVERVRD